MKFLRQISTKILDGLSIQYAGDYLCKEEKTTRLQHVANQNNPQQSANHSKNAKTIPPEPEAQRNA